MRKLQLTGQKFERLLVTGPAKNRGKRTFWNCMCDCGKRVSIGTEPLRRGLTISCGCYNKERMSKLNLSHGYCLNYKKAREYRAWCHAKGRCYNPKDGKFPIYGGRGIKMSAAWLYNFKQFIQDMGPCPKNLTLDRIDVNGNYEPGNCRWATWKEQRNNQRRSQ